jgi:hypothetical protein
LSQLNKDDERQKAIFEDLLVDEQIYFNKKSKTQFDQNYDDLLDNVNSVRDDIVSQDEINKNKLKLLNIGNIINMIDEVENELKGKFIESEVDDDIVEVAFVNKNENFDGIEDKNNVKEDLKQIFQESEPELSSIGQVEEQKKKKKNNLIVKNIWLLKKTLFLL